jgi:hypothetical protein
MQTPSLPCRIVATALLLQVPLALAADKSNILVIQDFPPRQSPSSFNLDDVIRSLTAGGEGK